MNWNGVMQGYLAWARTGSGRKSALATSAQEWPILDPDQPLAACKAYVRVIADAHTAESGAPAEQQILAAADSRPSARVRSWRRRVLLRRGALMRVAMGADAEQCSLAMLDEDGVVVSWRGRADGHGHGADHVVDHHVSQFYVPEDIARQQPLRDLHAATVEGSNTRQGWRRRPDGIAFWGATVIKAVMLRDGRLQGFSYLTRGAEGLSAQAPIAQRLNLPRGEEEENWDSGMRGITILPAWDRMARSRSAARQRRLFRLACRMRLPGCDLTPSRACGSM